MQSLDARIVDINSELELERIGAIILALNVEEWLRNYEKRIVAPAYLNPLNLCSLHITSPRAGFGRKSNNPNLVGGWKD